MGDDDYGIRQIDFGNWALDKWLSNEAYFKSKIVSSMPLRFCLDEVYKTLVRLGELPVFWKNKDLELIKEAMIKAFEWHPTEDDKLLSGIAKCILVLESMAEKRLSVTTGL